MDLLTDASHRFERGVDPTLQERAIERATQLLLDCAGGQRGPDSIVTRDRRCHPPAAPITLRHARIEHVLGRQDRCDRSSRSCSARLGMNVEAAIAQASWRVTPPSWRFDIRIEEDLIEEVARLYGFDNIPERDAVIAQTMAPWTETRVRNERAADLLVDRGYQEAITYTFTDARSQAILCPGAGARAHAIRSRPNSA